MRKSLLILLVVGFFLLPASEVAAKPFSTSTGTSTMTDVFVSSTFCFLEGFVAAWPSRLNEWVKSMIGLDIYASSITALRLWNSLLVMIIDLLRTFLLEIRTFLAG